jgi:hypothetical protein
MARTLKTKSGDRERNARHWCSPRPGGKPGRLAEFSFVSDAEIGREFTGELVAQAKSGIEVGEAGANQSRWIGLAIEIELGFGL